MKNKPTVIEKDERKEIALKWLAAIKEEEPTMYAIVQFLLEEQKKDIIKWAENEVGKKCAKNDFIYRYLSKK